MLQGLVPCWRMKAENGVSAAKPADNFQCPADLVITTG